MRDPALWIVAFTFYAGMHPRLTLELALLCYAGTVLVMVIAATWRVRRETPSGLALAIRGALLWGTLLFAIGLGWGATCGYILGWMTR